MVCRKWNRVEGIMLYLIRSFGRGSKSYLKIGFSDNLDNRLRQYRIHNPQFELISLRQGTQEDEMLLHMFLDIKGYRTNFLNEWFIDCPEVLTLFHVSIDNKLKKILWINRTLLFKIDDFCNPQKRDLFKNLQKLFYSGKPQNSLDMDWKFAEAREKLKDIKKKDMDLSFLL